METTEAIDDVFAHGSKSPVILGFFRKLKSKVLDEQIIQLRKHQLQNRQSFELNAQCKKQLPLVVDDRWRLKSEVLDEQIIQLRKHQLWNRQSFEFNAQWKKQLPLVVDDRWRLWL